MKKGFRGIDSIYVPQNLDIFDRTGKNINKRYLIPRALEGGVASITCAIWLGPPHQ